MPGWLLPAPLFNLTGKFLPGWGWFPAGITQGWGSCEKWQKIPPEFKSSKIPGFKSQIPDFLSCFHHLPAAGFSVPEGTREVHPSQMWFSRSENSPGAGKFPFGVAVFHKNQPEGEEILNAAAAGVRLGKSGQGKGGKIRQGESQERKGGKVKKEKGKNLTREGEKN